MVKYKNYDDSRKAVVCSALLPYNSADSPPSTEITEISLSLSPPPRKAVSSFLDVCVDFQTSNPGVGICWNTSAVRIKFPK
jgi:hypothetical protein